MKAHKITVIGSTNTDMVVQSSHLPAPGETVLGDRFVMNSGGKGANQAVAAAKLQGDVTFIAKVGNDLFGNQAIAHFQSFGIDTQYITTDATTASGVALILVDEQGENSIAVALGANKNLSKADIEPAKELLRQSSYVLMQLENSLELLQYVALLSRELNFRLVLNPAPAQSLSEEVLQSLYMLTPNAIEAGLLSGIEVTDEHSARQAANRLRNLGVQNVIITLGALGAYVRSNTLDELVPCPKVKVVDTTAAGDTFNGSLLVALTQGKDLKQAVAFANRAAAYSVGILGAQNAAPSLEDLASTH